MAKKRDYYEVLGVQRDASADAIKKDYRKLAMKYHPDRNPDDKAAEAKFKELSEAYEVLSDEDKRHQYDQFGHDGMRSTFGPGGFDFSRDFTHFTDLEDVLGSVFGQGGGMFDSLFGGSQRGGGRSGPQHGADLRFDLELDFEEAVFGSRREISLPMSAECDGCKGTGASPGTKKETCRQCGGHGAVVSGGGFFQMRQTCPVCRGSGQVIMSPCSKCGGVGRMKIRKRVTLRIPKGVETGSRLRLSGKGEAGAKGPPAGDLYVILHVRPHTLFERRGDDIMCAVPVAFGVAALGGEIQVPTLDGYAKLKIAPGTETHKVYRLRNKGVPHVNGHGRGDLLVTIIVEVPTGLSGKQKKVLKEFRESTTDANYPLAKQVAKQVEEFYARKDELAK